MKTCEYGFIKRRELRLDETHELLAEQTFAQHEIGVRQIGQRLKQYLTCDVHVESMRVQLIELQHGQICFQVVCVLSRLYFHIFL